MLLTVLGALLPWLIALGLPVAVVIWLAAAAPVPPAPAPARVPPARVTDPPA